MTDVSPPSTLQLLITQLPAILTALGFIVTAVLSWLNGRKVAEVKQQQTQLTTSIGEVAAHVDGAATKSVEKIQALLNERDIMRESAADAKQVAAVLAQAVATGVAVRAADPAGVPVRVADEQADSLKHIEVNTADTAKNTARTDAAVSDLKKEA